MRRRVAWGTAGVAMLGVALVGANIPGAPWSPAVIIAAYCFARSLSRVDNWVHSPSTIGPFLVSWSEKKILPTRLKCVAVGITFYAVALTLLVGGSAAALLWTSCTFGSIAIWALRYPSTVEEFERRVQLGKRIAWLR
jgi:uncharacterized membrane protein YbaN (DUF454 family)